MFKSRPMTVDQTTRFLFCKDDGRRALLTEHVIKFVRNYNFRDPDLMLSILIEVAKIFIPCQPNLATTLATSIKCKKSNLDGGKDEVSRWSTCEFH